MIYFSNYEADAVVREDENGQRFIKKIETSTEYPASSSDLEAWGIPSYGTLNYLQPITEQEYDGIGVTWG